MTGLGDGRVTLHTCHLAGGGPPFHPCRRAARALEQAGIDHELRVADRNRPLAFMRRGRRPGLRALSGQETLPVLELADGAAVVGSRAIAAWAAAHAREDAGR